jgi:glutaredoxin-related protein
MIRQLTDSVRILVHGALVSERGNRLAPVRRLRDVLGTVNDLAGRPFCSQAELDERRGAAGGDAAMQQKEAAPVMLYFDGKDHRTKKKMEELLRGRDVPFRVLDVSDDEATRSWALTASKLSEFPLIFVGGEAVGGLHELTQLDVNGELARRVFRAN